LIETQSFSPYIERSIKNCGQTEKGEAARERDVLNLEMEIKLAPKARRGTLVKLLSRRLQYGVRW